MGIRLDDTVLSRGLYEGDILYLDKERALVVHTPKCMVIPCKGGRKSSPYGGEGLL